MVIDFHCKIFEEPQNYKEILALQESLRDEVIARKSEGLVFFLEHTPVYTSGFRGKNEQFIKPIGEVPFYNVKRGGELTFHNPGQLVIYPVIDFRRYDFVSIKDFVLFFVRTITTVLRNFCGVSNICWNRDKPGIWAEDRKLAFVGLNFKKFVSIHGFSINICNDLTPFENIIPCGITNCKITSVKRETGRVFQPVEVANEIVKSITHR